MSPHEPTNPTGKPQTLGPYKPTVILHGGGGAISRSIIPPALYAQYHTSLLAYLTSAKSLLSSGGTAIDAACHAVSLMEDDPLFNCGRGSVFTARGEIEMEASIAVTSIHDSEGGFYEGQIKKSAAVSMIRRTRHPVLLAREVLRMGDEDRGMVGLSEMHGHLSGAGVERWGWREKGLEKKGRRWFWTRWRWEEHRRGLKHQQQQHGYEEEDDMADGNSCSDEGSDIEDGEASLPIGDNSSSLDSTLPPPTQGTVGAVCMDSWGTIVTATSTGGLTNKLPGRIGDTPTIGAGFWAESWAEEPGQDRSRELLSPGSKSKASFAQKAVAVAKHGLDFWVGDCVNTSGYENSGDRWSGPATVEVTRGQDIEETQKLLREPNQMTYKASGSTRKRAVAMSGTGNGDSFLRINACRTTAAMARFSPTNSVSLAEAVHAVAGPGGELQKSAGDRWGKTGQGVGGIIGIEIVESDGGQKEGNAVFDFNCGGLWRAYFEKDKYGNERPRVMVFREEY